MKINLVVIKTPHPEQLACFYGQLGMNFDHHKHGGGPLHFATEVDGVTFEIYPLPKHRNDADNTLRLGFKVINLDSLVDHLRKQGVKIINDPAITEWGYQALIEDPDGRKISLEDESVTIARYQIDETFKIEGRGLVTAGVILAGEIRVGDEISFYVNGSIRRRRIKGIDSFIRRQPLNSELPSKSAL